MYGRIFRGETWKLHGQVHDTPYLARYNTERLTLRDHYRHLAQLLPIYQAIETALVKTGLAKEVPEDLNKFLYRSRNIQNDLIFLRPFVSASDGAVLSTTNEYVKKINKLAESKEHSTHELMGCWVVRILGDLHGGQKMKIKLKQHAGRWGRASAGMQGLSFYQFEEGDKEDFITWTKSEKYNTDKTLAAIQEGFKEHIRIFGQLEATRTSTVCSNYSRFFTVRNVVVTAALAATAAFAFTL